MIANLEKLTTKIASRKEILNYLKHIGDTRKSRVVAMYNSDMDMLIEGKDQDLMVFPVCDRLPNRAHGCMETGNVKNYRLSGVNNHIDRLFNTAKILGTHIPLTKEQLSKKINDLALLAYKVLENENHPDPKNQVLVLKIWVSTGLGDFDIYGCDKKPIVYAALYISGPSEDVSKGVKEYIHYDQWTQPDYFANAKTVNYLALACMADYSKSRGGYFGIKTDKEGKLLEGAVSNIAYVLKDGSFGYPPLSKTIRGTTLTKAVKILQESNTVKEIKELEFTLDDLNQVAELFHLSNDHIVPILEVNDIKIGNGEIGPITQFLQEKLEIARASVQLDQGEIIYGLEQK